MIARVMAEGQYRLGPDASAALGAVDEALLEAVAQGDEAEFHRLFQQALAIVRTGEKVSDEEIAVSDLVLPPADTAMADVRRLLESAQD